MSKRLYQPQLKNFDLNSPHFIWVIIFDGFVKSLQLALCHSDPVFNTGEESNHINAFQILHGVYPELKIQTLRFTQGDRGEGFRMTNKDFLQDHLI